MLLRVGELQDYKILAKNGEIGHVEQLYFDDQTWAIKYIVVDLGNWLSGRTVLISPTAIIEANPRGKNIETALTREQIEMVLPPIHTNQLLASIRPITPSISDGRTTGV